MGPAALVADEGDLEAQRIRGYGLLQAMSRGDCPLAGDYPDVPGGQAAL